MTTEPLAALIGPTAAVIGRVLTGVTYWCLRRERTVDRVRAERFFHGGFTELQFQGDSLILSWAENAGWRDHFSLAIEVGPASRTAIDDYHEPFDAGASALWSQHVGAPLGWVRLLGWNATPHVLELSFLRGSVVVADGYQNPYGDGDDVAHWPAIAFWSGSVDEIQCLWRSPGAPDLADRS